MSRRVGLISNVEYGRVDGISLRLDAYLPPGHEKTPAIVMVHGGGWVAGDRQIDLQPLFEPLAEAGFAWFTISYRLAKDLTQFGVGISDVQQAIRHLHSHSTEYNIDEHRIALLGESAGAQLAAIAALRGGPEADVKAVVGFYMPSDLVSLLQTSKFVPTHIRDSFLGVGSGSMLLAAVAQLSPIENVRRDMPHFLLIHGTADPLVPFEQSRDMWRRMLQAGAACELYPVEGGGHGMKLWEASPQRAAKYKHKLVRWLRSELAGSKSLNAMY